ncbi:MAG: signal recognition particle-docking protein FtsY [Chlorobi bacterium]|nr:signal recognition particle-docking protein FtsY [Chlorobiota bacterium]MCI0716848.1 signal recognition particle-docking protein FtsY [Chlorobiota bacterium]
MGLFDRLKQGLQKTHENIFNKIDRLVNAKSEIDDEFLENLEEILLGSDVGITTAEKIINNLKSRVSEEKYERTEQLSSILRDELKKVFISGNGQVIEPFKITNKPHVIVVVGVNGVGKTTSIGKLAYNYKNAGYKVLIGAADTFRAAANEQLEMWVKRSGTEIIQLTQGSDPSAVVYKTIQSGIAKAYDVIIIDTAGRLHTKINLMEELSKIRRVIQKQLPDAPNEVLLVIDATTGQNGMVQAREFSSAIGVTGLILTKLDGTAKGGIVLKISSEMKIPVKYIGVGEQIDDLQVFDKESFVRALLED